MATEQLGAAGAQDTTNTAAHSAQDTSTSTATEGSSQSAKSYTQAEIDTMMGERAKRAQESATKKLLSALGLTSEADIEPLKATIEDARKKREADMTESQKALSALETANRTIATLQAERDQERAQRRQDRIGGAVEKAAAAMKANDAETVLLYLKGKHADALNAVLSDEGLIDEKKMAALLDIVKTEKPVYFSPLNSVPGSQSNLGGRTQPAGEKPDISKFKI